MHFWYNSNLD